MPLIMILFAFAHLVLGIVQDDTALLAAANVWAVGGIIVARMNK